MFYRKNVRLVSLFSGCGGLDKGLEMAGFKRVWANDFDKYAQAVFRLNLGEIDMMGQEVLELVSKFSDLGLSNDDIRKTLQKYQPKAER